MQKHLYELLKDNAYRQLDFQSSAIESIEKKLGVLLTAILGTPALIAVLQKDFAWNVCFTIGLLPLMGATYYAIKSLWCRPIQLPGDVKKFYEENVNGSLKSIQEHFIDDCSKVIKNNNDKLKDKGDNFNNALRLFCIAALIFIFGISGGRWLSMSSDNRNTQSSVKTSQETPTPTVPSETTTPTENPGIIPERTPTAVEVTKGTEPNLPNTKK